MAEYRISPWGEERADLRAAIGHAQFGNANRDTKKRREPFTPQDFMPFSQPQAPRRREMTPEQFVAAMDSFGNVVDKSKRRKRKRR